MDSVEFDISSAQRCAVCGGTPTMRLRRGVSVVRCIKCGLAYEMASDDFQNPRNRCDELLAVWNARQESNREVITSHGSAPSQASQNDGFVERLTAVIRDELDRQTEELTARLAVATKSISDRLDQLEESILKEVRVHAEGVASVMTGVEALIENHVSNVADDALDEVARIVEDAVSEPASKPASEPEPVEEVGITDAPVAEPAPVEVVEDVADASVEAVEQVEETVTEPAPVEQVAEPEPVEEVVETPAEQVVEPAPTPVVTVTSDGVSYTVPVGDDTVTTTEPAPVPFEETPVEVAEQVAEPAPAPAIPVEETPVEVAEAPVEVVEQVAETPAEQVDPAPAPLGGAPANPLEGLSTEELTAYLQALLAKKRQ